MMIVKIVIAAHLRSPPFDGRRDLTAKYVLAVCPPCSSFPNKLRQELAPALPRNIECFLEVGCQDIVGPDPSVFLDKSGV